MTYDMPGDMSGKESAEIPGRSNVESAKNNAWAVEIGSPVLREEKPSLAARRPRFRKAQPQGNVGVAERFT